MKLIVMQPFYIMMIFEIKRFLSIKRGGGGMGFVLIHGTSDDFNTRHINC